MQLSTWSLPELSRRTGEVRHHGDPYYFCERQEQSCPAHFLSVLWLECIPKDGRSNLRLHVRRTGWVGLVTMYMRMQTRRAWSGTPALPALLLHGDSQWVETLTWHTLGAASSCTEIRSDQDPTKASKTKQNKRTKIPATSSLGILITGGEEEGEMKLIPLKHLPIEDNRLAPKWKDRSITSESHLA